MQPNLVLLFVYGIERSGLSAVTDYHHSAGPGKTQKCPLYSLTPGTSPPGWPHFLAEGRDRAPTADPPSVSDP